MKANGLVCPINLRTATQQLRRDLWDTPTEIDRAQGKMQRNGLSGATHLTVTVLARDHEARRPVVRCRVNIGAAI